MRAIATKLPNRPRPRDVAYAVELVESVCLLAGSPDYLDGVRTELRRFRGRALDRSTATAAAYDW